MVDRLNKHFLLDGQVSNIERIYKLTPDEYTILYRNPEFATAMEDLSTEPDIIELAINGAGLPLTDLGIRNIDLPTPSRKVVFPNDYQPASRGYVKIIE